jgi:hypothetical protein
VTAYQGDNRVGPNSSWWNWLQKDSSYAVTSDSFKLLKSFFDDSSVTAGDLKLSIEMYDGQTVEVDLVIADDGTVTLPNPDEDDEETDTDESGTGDSNTDNSNSGESETDPTPEFPQLPEIPQMPEFPQMPGNAFRPGFQQPGIAQRPDAPNAWGQQPGNAQRPGFQQPGNAQRPNAPTAWGQQTYPGGAASGVTGKPGNNVQNGFGVQIGCNAKPGNNAQNGFNARW